VIPFDMAVIDTCDGQRIFSFLIVEWAMLADVDFDSEKYRFLGKIVIKKLEKYFIIIL
jgi:hypothetical protein